MFKSLGLIFLAGVRISVCEVLSTQSQPFGDFLFSLSKYYGDAQWHNGGAVWEVRPFCGFWFAPDICYL